MLKKWVDKNFKSITEKSVQNSWTDIWSGKIPKQCLWGNETN